MYIHHGINLNLIRVTFGGDVSNKKNWPAETIWSRQQPKGAGIQVLLYKLDEQVKSSNYSNT